MHRTFGYLSKRFVQIRPGEGRKVLLTFLYFFLIITAYYVIKPVSRSLVLGDLGSHVVPYVDLICAILMGPIVTLFARLVDRVPKPRLVGYSFWVVIGVLVGFWRLLRFPLSWIAGLFYVWVAIFSVLVVTLFWLVANDLYRPREAKRLFGFIGSGGILGGIVGSSIAAVGAQVIGTEHLLLLSAALLVLCWVVVQRLWKLSPERMAEEERLPPQPRRETFLSDPGGFTKLLFRSRYLLLLVAMVGLSKIVSTLVYYQLNPFIEQTFFDPDAKTTFVSLFFGGMNVISFIVQFFFTGWILRRWGLLSALLILPIGLMGGVAGFLLAPVLWMAAATELYDGSLNYSLQQTAKEMLYLPIDRSIRYKVKPFIDMVVFRFGKGIAAILGILLLDGLQAPPSILSGLIAPLLVVWVMVVVWLRRDYVATIRTVLQARAAAKRAAALEEAASAQKREAKTSNGEDVPGEAIPPPVERPDEPLIPTALLGPLTDSRPSGRKLALIQQLLGAADVPPAHTQTLLAALSFYETGRVHAFRLGGSLLEMKRLISDQSQPMATRCQAIRLLLRHPDQETVDYLFGLILVEEDAILRQEAVRALVRLRLLGSRLDFPMQPIRRQIVREVADYQRIGRVAAFYRRHQAVPSGTDDSAIALMRILMEESLEQIFRFLMLLYRPEDIHLVYEQFRSPDTYLSSDALELLDNLVDAKIRSAILPVVGEDQWLEAGEGGAARDPASSYRLLQEAIWDHNCWLSVTTLCAVGRLRLTTMQQELERASQHTTPILAAAGKVALHLSTLPSPLSSE